MNPGVGFDWGPAGARAAVGSSAALVIVDVLSFSTAVSVAAGRGTAVFPHTLPAPGAGALAAERDAALAVPRDEVSEHHPWSLSPAHLLAAPAPGRLVLPSPNGSSIAASAAGCGCVLAGCPRNATAVARWLLRAGFGTAERPVTVIAAGERWPDGELRPALEDLLGASAIIAALAPQAVRSPAAVAAGAVWPAHGRRLSEFLRESLSGRELAGHGYAADVRLAGEHDADDVVPVLTDGAFVPVEAPG
jgi:2-phosphosulfolactate phosphatase